jgi:hypothetical protein
VVSFFRRLFKILIMAMKEFIKRIFGSEESGYRTAHDRRAGDQNNERKRNHPLEGAGRSGWDTEQNRGYSRVYGNHAGPSTYVERGEMRHFQGRGPKNYRRADERIRDDINDALTDDQFLDATNIEVEVKDGEVTLVGQVEDRQAKRRAEDLAETISGVKHLENRLRIAR